MLERCWKVRREDIHDFMRWTFINVVVLDETQHLRVRVYRFAETAGVDPSFHGGEAGRNPGGVGTVPRYLGDFPPLDSPPGREGTLNASAMKVPSRCKRSNLERSTEKDTRNYAITEYIAHIGERVRLHAGMAMNVLYIIHHERERDIQETASAAYPEQAVWPMSTFIYPP